MLHTRYPTATISQPVAAATLPLLRLYCALRLREDGYHGDLADRMAAGAVSGSRLEGYTQNLPDGRALHDRLNNFWRVLCQFEDLANPANNPSRSSREQDPTPRWVADRAAEAIYHLII